MKKKKKRTISAINLLFEIVLFLLVIVTILFVYLGVILSHKPRSFPVIKEKISEILNDKLENVTISDASIHLTATGNLRIVVKNFNKVFTSEDNKKTFSAPKIDLEYSLPHLLLLQFYPHQIKITNPVINFHDDGLTQNQKSQELSVPEIKNIIHNSVQAIKSGKINTRNFVIENAKINYTSNFITSKILLKRSQIKTSSKYGKVKISFENTININNGEKDIVFDSHCKEQFASFACDVELTNLPLKSVANLNPQLAILKNINAEIALKAQLKYAQQNLQNIEFELTTKRGNFFLPEYFAKEMAFQNLFVKGSIDNNNQKLNLEKISTNFDNSKFLMTLNIENYRAKSGMKAEFYIHLNDVKGNDIDKFWPLFVEGQDIRKWVTTHISNGIISDAYTKFTIINEDDEKHLKAIDANVKFSKLDLNYDDYFPQITNIEGEAKFDIKGMKISVKKAEVLESQISEGTVAINDFFAKQIMLDINAKASGKAYDMLKHINHQDTFFKSEIEQYLNGNHQSNIAIRVPLHNKINLKDVGIKINSTVSDIKTENISGKIAINIDKKTANNRFFTNVDFKEANLDIAQLGGKKELGQESKLSFILIEDQNLISLKNIKFFEKTTKNSHENPQVTGEIEFEVNPFLATKISIVNHFFDQNNYRFDYSLNKKTFSNSLIIAGTEFDLYRAIDIGFSMPKSSGQNQEAVIQSEIIINLDKAHLANKKGLENVNINITCFNKICESGFIRADYFDENQLKSLIDFNISKNAKNDFSEIKGTINNISYLADGLDISNLLSPSIAQINIKNSVNNNAMLLSGELKFRDDLIIYDNEKIKEIVTKDSLLSQVKDAIYSDNKTTLNKFVMQFSLQNNIFNIRSLEAHNYKIGITAQGTINLNDQTIKIEGLIIPSYVVNNLFSIGKIPVVGKVISEVLTGGDASGGLFGIKYEYIKDQDHKEGKLKTNKASSIVPVSIRRIFE